MGTKCWLAMRPVQFTKPGVKFPEGCLGVLALYQYKKDARANHGKNIPLTEIELLDGDTK